MLKNFTFLICILILASVDVNAQKIGGKSEDEAMIRAKVEQMVKGWNTKSGAGFAKPFAEDSDYVVINGMHIEGRETIAQSHLQILDTFYKNTSIALSVEKIRFLRPDVAVVHVFGTAETLEGDSKQTSKARITPVMTKNKDARETAAFRKHTDSNRAGRIIYSS